MFLTIVISANLLMLIAMTVFLVARYVPIITNLFMNVTIRRVQDGDERSRGEDVSFETADGVRLVGTLGPPRDFRGSTPVVVFCHEFTSNRHSAVKYARFLEQAGFRVFTFDFRGHGDSDCPGGYAPRQWVTQYELADLRAALSYLRSRDDVRGSRVALFGVSRGAAVAIVAASNDPDVACVACDGAFSTSHTLKSYMRRWAPIFVERHVLVLSRLEWVLSLFRWAGTKLAEHRLGVRFVQLSAALRNLKQPILMIHGHEDGYVEVQQVKLLTELVGAPKELWIVPGADHNRAVEVAPSEYRQRLVRFLRSKLKTRGSELKSPTTLEL